MKSKKRFGLLVALCLTVVMLIGLTVFASPVSAEEQNGWIYNDGNWYYYEAGAAYADGLYLVGDDMYYFDAEGVMADNEWVLYDEVWYFAKPGGALCSNEICNIGGTLYAFNGGCGMYDNGAGIVMKETANGYEELYVYAKAGGALYANEWLLLDGDWHYAKADGTMCRNEIYNVGGVLYGFAYSARMYDDEVFSIWHEDEDGGYETYHEAKPGGALYVNEWYLYEDTESDYTAWYYYDEKGEMPHGYKVVGGVPYLFWYGEMMEGPGYQDGPDGNLYHIDYLDHATLINPNGWTKIGSKWIYMADGVMYEDGVYEIDGTLYAFEYGFMVDDASYYDYDYDLGRGLYYYAQVGGALYTNAWLYDGYNWQYYGADGAAYADGVYNIGGAWYLFDGDGDMAVDTSVEYEDGYVYVADESGKLTYTQNGWLLDEEGDWMWVVDGEIYWEDGMLDIGGVTYVFRSGRLAPNIWIYDGELDGMILSGPDGVRVTKGGWHVIEDEYVYLDGETGLLLEDWQLIDGTWYMFDPIMEYGTLQLDWDEEIRLYAFNAAGQYTQITTDGLYEDEDGDMVLIENGKVVADEWRLIGGYWYYFGSGYAQMGTRYIDTDETDDLPGSTYYFDESRRMIAGGWYQVEPGEWLYADASGALYVDGTYEIGGTEYIFYEDGRLQTDEMWIEYDKLVLIDGSGAVSRYALTEGWNNINGDWYYYEDGDLVFGYYLIDGDTYYFHYDTGVMLADKIYNDRYFGADGRMQIGWIRMADGSWMYADEDGELYYDGDYTIDGKDYMFVDGKMLTNRKLVRWGLLYTIDANGVIVDVEYVEDDIVEGWNYFADGYYGEEGRALYVQNGMPYSGWLGDRYFRDGEMIRENVEMIGGQMYIFDTNGYLLRNTWMEIPIGPSEYHAYVYGDANGHPYCDQWLYSGGKWYYFDGYVTACDTFVEIDGVYHLFDENSVWMGEESDLVDMTNLPDGWNKVGGKWYYAMAGEPLYGEVYDGVWYYCDLNGMVTNSFAEGHAGMYYYGASGARAEYVGWHMIDGSWVYFKDNHEVALGWFTVNGTSYYVEESYERNGQEYTPTVSMVTGYRVYDDKLLHFDASGAYTGTVTGDGWFYGDGDWYYLNNGRVCRDELIEDGGARYYVDYDGKMATNDVAYGYCFGADGKAVMDGWVLINGEWLYAKNGRACVGTHLIDGTVYYFNPYIF